MPEASVKSSDGTGRARTDKANPDRELIHGAERTDLRTSARPDRVRGAARRPRPRSPGPGADPVRGSVHPDDPRGGGPTPADPDPEAPSSFEGTGEEDESAGAAAPASSGDDGSGSAPAVAPTPSTATSEPAGRGNAPAGGSDAERTIDALAQQARDERAARDLALAGDAAPADLRRSESGSGAGMGIFLWAVLGLTLIWALGTRYGRGRDAAPLT